jgi:hypothetical protein
MTLAARIENRRAVLQDLHRWQKNPAVTPAEAARMLRVSDTRLRSLIACGRVSVELGTGLVRWSELVAFCESSIQNGSTTKTSKSTAGKSGYTELRQRLKKMRSL